MTPEQPKFSSSSQFQILANVDPLYYLTSTDYVQGEDLPSGSPNPYDGWGFPRIHEEQAAPLAAARQMDIVTSLAGENILQISPSSATSYDINAITDEGFVYGINSTGLVFGAGQFVGGAANAGNVFEHYNGRLYATNSNITTIAYCELTTPGFNYITGARTATLTGKPYMKAFLDNLYYSCGSTSGEASHLVKYIDQSHNVIDGLDLGRGWHIVGMENYNNNYLIIAGAYSGTGGVVSSAQSNQNYLFIWDGTTANNLTGTGGTYNRAVRIPGAFKDMKMVGDNLYVVVTEKLNQDAVYLFTGGSLQRQFPVVIDTTSDYNGLGSGYSIFNYNQAIGLTLTNGGLYVIGETSLGQSKYILSKDQFDGAASSAQGGALYAFNGGNVYLYKQAVNLYEDIFMRTQWIDTGGLSLGSIDIYYERLTSEVVISTTLYGKDFTGTVYPITLDNVTLGTSFSQEFTTIDTNGFTGDRLRIDMNTTSSPANTQVVIRRIVLNFS